MVKSELIKVIAERTNLKPKDAESILNTINDIIVETISKGEDVKFGIGTFKRRETKGREGVSKLHGVETHWKTEDSFKPIFVPSKHFSESVK